MTTIDTSILCDIAKKAGKVIMYVYNTADFGIKEKEDNSPVTRADLAANEVICTELKKHFPDIPILSEESKQVDYSERKDWKNCFIVDPLDGTKEFIKKNGEFTVNIAYAEEGIVKEGVIYAPALEALYYTSEGKSFVEDPGERARELPFVKERSNYKVVASRSHPSEENKNFLDDLKTRHPDMELVNRGSSLKFCMVASGTADIYPRLAPTMEWDTAAAQAIVEQAGGSVYHYETGEPLRYNREDLLNPWFIVKGK